METSDTAEYTQISCENSTYDAAVCQRCGTKIFPKQRTKKLEDLGHDPTDFSAAMEKGYQWDDVIPIGLFWKRGELKKLQFAMARMR